MNILNVAAGKIEPLELPEITETLRFKRLPKFIVNIDTCYLNSETAAKIEKIIQEKRIRFGEKINLYCNNDIFNFMERTILTFEQVVIYRFLEHVSFTQLNYFIYLISTITKKGSIVDIIVPNYEILAKMILNEKINKRFEASNILLTTELLNEPSCPHASIWTPQRAKYFWELEGRFSVSEKEIYPKFSYDGRNIYMRFIASRL